MPEEFPCRTHCPINFALESFGDKWTLLIIRDLMFKAKQSFGDFLSSDEKISTNILADRLRRLEQLGIVSKATSEKNRSKSIYSLTQKGRDLLPIMLEITRWSGKHDPQTHAPDALLQRLEADTPSVITQITAGWDAS
ncbi:DNA-binding transcriptional regulator, HxlR family [Halopseudomonas sabulinigri]|uniref:DNA-binding transcriptional regulator, HxlR family n=1 Tax=Halopseudomonas sabulinigri TaxID=472181 RepID=A0A1H1RIX7_9GAMM|nr:helix-turn-helix domain-containing protein [Halopseudomonas sabulinigri]SDS35665.1 DNA-binding transcriptional regulator, HxlR family [Halopseudomonas sabulinigri]